MNKDEKLSKSDAYIRAIRNTKKHCYAMLVRNWYKEGKDQLPNAQPPECTSGLGYMAAQMVRCNLFDIWYQSF